VGDGIAAALERDGLHVVDEVEGADVVVQDIDAEPREIATAPADPKVLVLAGPGQADHVLAALAAGASGYVLKDEAADEVVAGIVRATAAGATLVSPRVAERAEEHRRALSPRETEVLRLIADGRDNPDIARELVISQSTVKRHVEAILGKLGVENRVQAAVAAVRRRLV
jgi:DNA-binding NarL/FixJ family response regulator